MCYILFLEYLVIEDVTKIGPSGAKGFIEVEDFFNLFILLLIKEKTWILFLNEIIKATEVQSLRK